MTGMKNMLTILQELGGTVLSNLSEAHKNFKSSETAIQLLECYSCKLLPWIHENGGSEDFVVQFAVDIWSQGLLDAMTKAMKISVVCCSVESQNVAIQKAYIILSSHTNFQLNEAGGLPLTPGKYDISVIIALRPKTHIPNIRVLLNLFIIALLDEGVVLVAQALGSMINKLASKSNGAENSGELTLEEALDVASNHVSCGLSWIGKGLLLHGHKKIKDITMIFMECLISGAKSVLPSVENTEEQKWDPLASKCAADAFHVLMSDSEVCLNKKFHAIIRSLYKQKFFSSMMPIFQQLITRSDSSLSRYFLYRAFAHIVSDTPLIVILNEAKKVIPVLLDCLSMLTEDIQNKDTLYGLLFVLSGILTEKTGNYNVCSI